MMDFTMGSTPERELGEALDYLASEYDANDASVEAARAILQQATDWETLPKIAVDGDGDINLVWMATEPAVVFTIEPDKIHALVGPGTSGVQYFDSVPFDGKTIPASLALLIPQAIREQCL